MKSFPVRETASAGIAGRPLGNVASSAPEAPRGIPTQIQCSQENLKQLHELISVLEARARPLCQNVPGEPTNDAEKMPPPTNVAEEIGTIATGIHGASERIGRLIRVLDF